MVAMFMVMRKAFFLPKSFQLEGKTSAIYTIRSNPLGGFFKTSWYRMFFFKADRRNLYGLLLSTAVKVPLQKTAKYLGLFWR